MNRREFLKSLALIPGVSILNHGSKEDESVIRLSGEIILHKPIVINYNNVSIVGDDTTIIKIADRVPEKNYGAIRLENCKNVTISDLNIDGNKQGQLGYERTPPLIRAGFVDGLRIHNNVLHDSAGDSIEVIQSSAVAITKNVITDGTQHGVHLENSKYCLVAHNTVIYDGNSAVVAGGHGALEHCFIVENTLVNNLGQGSYLIQVGGEDGGSFISVHGNSLLCNDGFGITCLPGLTMCTVIGNIVQSPASSRPWIENPESLLVEEGNLVE